MKYIKMFNENRDLSDFKEDIEDIFVDLFEEGYIIKYETSLEYTKVILTKRKEFDILNEKVIDVLKKLFEYSKDNYSFINKVVFHYSKHTDVNAKKYDPKHCVVKIDDFINGELPEMGMDYCRLILFNINT